jgi:hypothetical protein
MPIMHITTNLNDWDDSDREGSIEACQSFVQCVEILVGAKVVGGLTVGEKFVSATFVILDDEKAQAMEELIGQTLWDVQLS